MWRGLVRGARMVVPVVIVGALVQALLVVGDPVPEVGWAFALRALASGLAIVLVVWLILGAAANAVDVDERLAVPPIRLLAGVTAAVVVGVFAGLLSPLLPIVVAVVALPLLSALAVRPRMGAFRSVTFAPVRAVFGFLLVAALAVVNWVVALLLGFFVDGPIAAASTWLVFGISTAIAATSWAALQRRAQF